MTAVRSKTPLRAARSALLIAMASISLADARGQAQDNGASPPPQDSRLSAAPNGPLPAPSLPEPVPPASVPPATGNAREADLESRLRQMEELNRKLADKVDLLVNEVKDLRQQVKSADAGGEVSATPPSGAPGGGNDGRDPGIPNYSSVSGTRKPAKVKLMPTFGAGFQLESEDEEFQLQFHQETQIDYRIFEPNGETFARSGIIAPRIRAFFNGHVTKDLDYMFSINKGFGNLNILDAYINIHNGERLQFKVGRFMTPFNYEQFAIQNMWLVTPERSVFTSNLGLNRQFGGMFWGYLFDKKLDYAVGGFDGPRNSYQDYNEAKDILTYANFRPFQDTPDGSLLHDLNIGGSFAYGDEDNPLQPTSFRVAANASNDNGPDVAAPPFLSFNSQATTRERGERYFWSGHVAYYYKGLSVFADYNGGILHYALTKNTPSTRLPTDGMSVSAGYFVTGETIERRTSVTPLHPFSLKKGQFGLGAVELVARYSNFEISRAIFSSGLADPTKWSNTAWTTNIGLNWYPNTYLKFYFDWQHAEFGNPVQYAPGKKALTNEMFWFRTQFYF